MFTPQEVSEKVFPKASFGGGGYNMASVDEFLDALTEDYTALFKENVTLKAKLKVLVEKVEDYRATEDSMRATLLTAQKMADSIVREAEAKRDEIMAQAETQAQEKIAQLRREIGESEDRLRQGQQELAKFIASSRDICSQQLAYLDQLPQLPVEQPTAVPAEEKAQEIEENVLAAFARQDAEEETEESAEEPAPADDYPEGDPFAREEPEEVSEPTRRLNLNDLKFGRNYKGE